jgi:uncharacterized protein YprB with RNaseH-like and TPR domain
VDIERIGFLDIESSNLNASFGYVFTYCIKELDNPKILERTVTRKDIHNKIFDKRIMEQLIKDFKNFDRIVVYWGKNYRFDIPFLRSRCLRHGIDFPGYKELFVTDLYDSVKSKLRLGRNSLLSACRHLGINAKDTPIEPQLWMDASTGDEKALATILQHNREDVISTEELWKVMRKFSGRQRSSL